MSDAQKIATVLPEVQKVLAAEEQAKAAAPLAAPVVNALGLDKPAAPVQPTAEEKKLAGYVDTSKLAPKKEGYAPDTENKKFFDFVQDRYRSGSLGVAPGYNFYSDSPLYNDKLVEEYKARYPELAAEYAANPDAAKYSKVENQAQKNEHELAGFWDYAAGRQEKDDLRNLYMYGFKSDDPRANPEIMQRLKDENPWLWEEYQKSMADAAATKPAPGQEVPPSGDGQKPVGAMDDGKLHAQTQEEKIPDIIGMLGKMGYSALEILQAGMAGGAGITDFNQTSAGRRVQTEKEAKAAADKLKETEAERAFQEKLIKMQDENDNRRMMADQTFQSAMKDKDYSQAEKMAIADQARALEMAGYDRETAIILADKAAAAATQSAAIKAGTDPLGIKGMDTLDTLFANGQISKESYDKAKSDQKAKEDADIKAKGTQAYYDIFGAPKAGQGNGGATPAVQVAPGAMPPPPTTQQKPLTIDEALAKLKTPAEKQKFLMNAGFKELPGSGGMWQGPSINGQPGKAVKI